MSNLHVKPGSPLSRFVELLWYYENAPQPHQKERLMPDGCITLIISLLEDETRLYDPDDTKKVRKIPRVQHQRSAHNMFCDRHR